MVSSNDFGVETMDVDQEPVSVECPLPMRNGGTKPDLATPTVTTDNGHHQQRKNPILGSIVKVLEHSTLRFQDLSFLVGTGKTTLINVLTLDAFYGKAMGAVTLNGTPMTGDIFKKHCFIVKQQDKHWPYLTTRETLQYAAGLYHVSSNPENIPIIVDELINKLGLTICADTRCARLSGGQQRRLSIAIALLKKPTVLFLDEPTSGLDAAAATNIMQEITRVAKEDNLIVVCTIHQPSTKVYHGFDKVMIMSRGREAFAGTAAPDATEYFARIGYPLPEETNPAEHFLDLVNSDFSGTKEVERILDTWKEHQRKRKEEFDEDDVRLSSEDHQPTPYLEELIIMFRRHFLLVVRDPILYLGRCVVFLVMGILFSFVYWNARELNLEQVYSKLWAQLWFSAVPAQMGVVAVYVLNDEFKSIQREAQNGMSRASTYLIAKTVLVLPILFVFGLVSLVIPSMVIQGIPWSALGLSLMLHASLMFVFESFAEMLSVALDNPILGMLGHVAFWFGGFLFGGFLIPVRDLYMPFELFFYVMPFGYYVRSIMYVTITETDWVRGESITSAEVLDHLEDAYAVVHGKDTVWQDIITLIGIGLFWKLVYVVLFMIKTQKVATIHPPERTPKCVEEEEVLFDA